MKKINTLTIALFFTLAIISCKKYDEGPGLSLRSKKERIANEWKIEKAISNGTDVTSFYSAFTYKLTKEGTYETIVNTSVSSKGTWKFDDKKENFLTKPDNSSTETSQKILKLKEDEFWTLDEKQKLEIHFKTK